MLRLLIRGTYDGLKEDGGCTVMGNLGDSNRAEALVDLEVKSLCEAAGLSEEERARDMTQGQTERADELHWRLTCPVHGSTLQELAWTPPELAGWHSGVPEALLAKSRHGGFSSAIQR
ncbi:hypothetical protein DHEL01_v200713 [Diaporthe helianthi]|uniref:Uncharacterized protein n=1 Tax=Diaporthe helianthi TaxID=158607 RepID=A0A2P5IEG9_DIAHE|nr:hypothetical protein DHEL01_v200713 [Diaporthe helianthi]